MATIPSLDAELPERAVELGGERTESSVVTQALPQGFSGPGPCAAGKK